MGMGEVEFSRGLARDGRILTLQVQVVRGARTALSGAPGSGEDVVRALLAAGADPNGVVQDGAEPLAVFAATGNGPAVRVLRDAGARMVPGKAYDAAMSRAVREGKPEVVGVLLDLGVGVSPEMVEIARGAITDRDTRRQREVLRLLESANAPPPSK
jgi:ankyrin repeat protein